MVRWATAVGVAPAAHLLEEVTAGMVSAMTVEQVGQAMGEAEAAQARATYERGGASTGGAVI